MTRLILLASIASLALTTIAAAETGAPAATAVAVVVPEPPPRGLLGGLFKRKPRPPEVPPEVLSALEASSVPEGPPAAAAPIDLVPPDAAAGPQEAATPAPERTSFVLRRVPDDQIPLPRANPLRAPVAAASVDLAAAEPAPPVDPPAVPPAPGAFEPAVPPPAMAATEPAVRSELPDAGTEEMLLVEPEPLSSASEVLLDTGAATGLPVEVEVEVEPAVEELEKVEEALPPDVEPAPAVAGEPDTDEAALAPVRVVGLTEAPAEPAPSLLVERAEDFPAAATPDQRMAAEKLVAAAYTTASPRELVDLLSKAQDAIAVGSAPALAAQGRIMARIDDVFADADPAVWQEPANAIAAVTYVLSGGPPAILRRFAEMDPPPAADARLPRGALAYVEGRQGEAAGMLVDLDVEKLPARIGGQVALAQAALLVGTDPRRALAALDMARLVAPGTLVEEAAIRRSLLIVDRLADPAVFERLSRQYLSRFRHSVYAGNFRYRFAAALTRSPLLDDPARFDRLDALLALLEPEAQRGLYLTVASAAVVAGKMAAGAYTAEKALGLAPPQSPDLSRAHLYRAAALVLGAETLASAEADLAATNLAMLQPSDRALHDAVSRLAASIRAASDPTTITVELEPAALPGEEPPEDLDPLIERAKALSEDVDLLLASAS